jgi:lipid-binding SYLF domain-containing protein
MRTYRDMTKHLKPDYRLKNSVCRRRGYVLSTIVAAVVMLSVSGAPAQGETEAERLRTSATALTEILGMPESIPKELIDKAECVIVIPSVKKLALGVGGSYGRGAMTCRSGEAFDGPWSAPAMYALEGASVGFQLGGQETDYVLLVMNDRGAQSVLTSKVKLGADASAAAGPKGRTAGAATDIVMRAEILTYSRARGLFAGVSLEGSTLRSDGDANRNVYGKDLSAREIVREAAVPTTAEGKVLLDILTRRSPKNLSEGK